MGAEPSADLPATCVAVTDPIGNDESPVYFNSIRIRENGGVAISTFRSCPEVLTTPDLLHVRSTKWPDHPLFGERLVNSDGTFGKFQWMTGTEVIATVRNYAAGLAKLGVKQGDKVGIYSPTCKWWALTEYATHYLGAIVVPVYDSLGPNAAEYIVGHAEAKTIIVHHSVLDKALCLPNIDRIILIAEDRDTNYPDIMTCKEVTTSGCEYENTLQKPTLSGDDIAMIMYTSGSTGKPKGCVLTHRNLIAGGCGLSQPAASITSSDVYYAFLPLAHVYEICAEVCFMAQGVAIGYYCGDMRKLTDDLQMLQPTIMLGVPRVFNRLYETMTGKIEKLPSYVKMVMKGAIKLQTDALKNDRSLSLLLDRALFGPFKAALGGRIRLLVSGGAPILPDVADFIKAVITPNVIQGYGLTECSAAGCIQEVKSKNPQGVGPISYATDLKFRRVEGMDYNPVGDIPSGEILLRGPSQFREYYKDPALTQEAIVDGWFATGDIGCLLPDGTVQIVDRVKQLVKLSQGEYISMTALTEMYQQAKLVENIYIYADSHHNYPVALVIPSADAIGMWKERGITNIIDSQIVKSEILASLLAQAEESKVRGFEKIQDILIELDPFTIENQLLTPSLKPQFNEQRKKYAFRLVELYKVTP